MHDKEKTNIVLVTIGIPFYNAEKYIDYAIRSVINQSYNNWELILSDDGSTDKSVEIAKKYLYDKRVKLISDGENKGLPFRLNQQIGLANGNYFARMDADDIMHPERIERQVEYLEANLSIDVIGSSAYSIDTENNVCGLLVSNAFPATLDDVFNNRCFIHPSVMARLSWYKNNLYSINQIRMEDGDLWAKSILKLKFANLQLFLMFYRCVGIFSLEKYLKSKKGSRRLIRKTFKGTFFMEKYKLLVKNYAKVFVISFFSIIKREDILLKRRHVQICEKEKHIASIFLQKAINGKT